jgi:hypothetical protein
VYLLQDCIISHNDRVYADFACIAGPSRWVQTLYGKGGSSRCGDKIVTSVSPQKQPVSIASTVQNKYGALKRQKAINNVA